MSLYLNTDNFLANQIMYNSINFKAILFKKNDDFFLNFKNLPFFKMVHAICPDV